MVAISRARRRLAVVWVMALVGAFFGGPLLNDGAAFGGEATGDGATYRFEFADGSVIEGSNLPGQPGFTGNKNEADLGLSSPVHVSCSDTFGYGDDDPSNDGWGEKGGPVAGVDPSPVVAWSITKYKKGAPHKTCRGPETSSPDTTLPPGEDPDNAGAFFRPVRIDVEKWVSVDGGDWFDADAPTGPEAFAGEDVRFRFDVANTGAVGLHDVTLVDSDFALPAGLPTSLAPGDSFSVEIGPFPAVEGQHRNDAIVTAVGSRAEPHPATSNVKRHYSFLLTDGRVIEGASDRGDIEVGFAAPMHISCSDLFGYGDDDPSNDGWGEKGGPVAGVDDVRVEGFKITVYDKDGAVKRTCGANDPTVPLTVGDEDPAHYLGIVLRPGIDLEKSTNGEDADEISGPVVRIGDPVEWTYEVTNTGDLPLRVFLEDDQLGPVECPRDHLDPGESMTCAVSGMARPGQYRNVATVTGDAPDGSQATDTDPSHYFGAALCPTDAFEPDAIIVTIGEELLDRDGHDHAGPFSAIVPAGAYRVTLVSYDDHSGGEVSQPHEQWFVELRDAAGDVIYRSPAIADLADAEDWLTEVVDDLAGLDADIATVDAFHVRAGKGDGSVTAVCAVFEPVAPPQPGIDIEKATNGVDADTPPGSIVVAGDPVIWTFTVANTGNVDLVDVVVTDDVLGEVCRVARLAVGAEDTCSVDGTAVEGQHRNVATATAVPVDSDEPVHDDDVSHYLGKVAGVDIEKLVGDDDADAAPGPYRRQGSDVRFHFVVENTGDVDLIDVAVTDDVFGEICRVAELAPGERAVCALDTTVPTGAHVNTAEVVGTPAVDGAPIGEPVRDDDPAHLFGWVAAVDIEKATNGADADRADDPDVPSIPIGEAVEWTYVVTNTGNVPLTAVTVNDDRLGSVSCPGNELEPGASMTCTATGIASLQDGGIYVNLGTARGFPTTPDGRVLDAKPVEDRDPSHYRPVPAMLDIEKATNGEDADDPTGPIIAEGDAVTWTYEVTVVGSVAIADVAIEDSDAAVTPAFVGGDDGDGLLEPGEVWRYEAQGVAVVGQYRNVATATGVPVDDEGRPVGPTLTASDPSHYLGAPRVDLGDFVWEDVDGDGLQDAGEPGVGGVVVRLFDADDREIATTVTGPDGDYRFTDLAPGDYVVVFEPPTGYRFTRPNVGDDDAVDSDAGPASGRAAVTLGDADDLTIDAGIYRPASVGDFVWEDLDGDGVQDAGEPGVPGVSVMLHNGDGLLVGATVTDDAGRYGFEGLRPGEYTVMFTAPPGFGFTLPNAGGDDARDSDADPADGVTEPVMLASGRHDPTVDAGLVAPASLGDFVWHDLDADGIQDAGEPGMGGVTVALFDGDGALVATTTTDPDGVYGFEGLAPAVYTVAFEVPAGFEFTAVDVGDDRFDSDADPSTGLTSAIELESGGHDPTIDAGVVAIPVGIDLEKLIDGIDADEAPGPIVPAGSVVPVTFVVTNTGGLDLVAVTVGDDVLGTVCTIDLLEVGAAETCTIDLAIPAGQHVNEGTAVGQPVVDNTPVGEPVTDVDLGHAFGAGPGIDIEKATNGVDADTEDEAPEILAGTPVEWTYLVTNTGNTALAGVVVNDDRLPVGSVICPADTLAVGATMTCSATGVAVAAGDSGPYRNTGSVVARPVDDAGEPIGPPVDDRDPSHYLGVTARIDVEKLTNGEDADSPPGPQLIAAVDAVTWTYLVTNTGSVAIEDVTLTDDDPDVTPIFVGGDDGDGLLEPGEVWRYEASGIAELGPYENVAAVTGQPVDRNGAPLGDPVSDGDPSHYLGVEQFHIGDFVWHDRDVNGIQDDGVASRLPGITVRLFNEFGGLLATTVTDDNGIYGFDVIAGTYVVGFEAPDGFEFTTPDVGGDDAVDSDVNDLGRVTVVVAGDDLTIDAGVFTTARIGDRVWDDLDNDGIQDEGEPGIAGVAVELHDADGFVAATVTDDAGTYGFEVQPGDYTVIFERPSGYVPSPVDQGDDDAVDSDAHPFTGEVELSALSGDEDLTIDAGFVKAAALGDFVWTDLDGDGLLGAEESGLGGVVVRLLDGDSELVIATGQTASGGFYRFDDLPPGEYRVEFVAPQGWVFTLPDVGSDDAIDSDADPATGRTGVISLDPGEEDLTNDAGLVPPIDLGIVKTADVAIVQPGGSITYTLEVANHGPGLARDVVVIDTLPAGVTFVSADSRCSYDPAPHRLQCELGELAGGDGTEIEIVVTVDADAAGELQNVAVVASEDDRENAPDDTNPDNDRDDEPVVVDRETGTIGDLVWLDEDADGVPDDGEPGLPGVTVVLDDGGVTQSAVTDDDGRYLFVDLPEGDYTVRVDLDSVPADLVPTTDVTVDVALGEGDEFLDADFGFVGSESPALIDLEVTKTVDPDRVTGGEPATYTLTVVNRGPANATGVVLLDTLPEIAQFVSASGEGAFDPDSGRWTVGDLAAGERAELAIVVTFPVSSDRVTNTVEVIEADQPDVDSTPGDGEGDDYAEVAIDIFTVSPTTVPTTTPPTSTTSAPTTTGPDTLPRTGIETDRLFGYGLGLVTVGLLALLAVRRRDEDTDAS